MAQLQATGVTGSLVTTGNVGVGTTNITFSNGSGLVVHSTGASRIKLSNPSSGQGATDGFEFIMAALDAYVYNYEAGPMIFGTNSSERMRILSGGNIGIGTTEPAYKLQVNGTGYFADDLTVNSNINLTANNSYINIGRATTSSDGLLIYKTEGSNRWLLGAWGNSNNTFYLYSYGVGGSVVAVDYSTGNVGIGTTNPAIKLQVVGANTAEGQLYVGNTDVTYSAGINFTTSGANRGFVGWRHTNSGAPFSLTGVHLFNTDNSNLVFGTNNLVRAVINVNGNLGIGTDSPTTKLQVQGSTRIVGDLVLGGGSRYITGDGGDLFIDTENVAGRDILLQTVSGQNVGIGLTNPSYKLDVDGVARGTAFYAVNDRNQFARGFLRLTSATNNTSTLDIDVSDTVTSIYSNYFGGGADQPIRIGTYANLANQLYLATSGNVGIGTASPNRKFVVRNASTDEWIGTFTNTGTNPYGIFVDTSANTSGGYTFAAYTYAGTGFFVKNDGYVGIGTATPRKELDVQGNNLCVVAGQLILGEDAYSTSANYIGLKTSFQSGANDYMILSGKADGATYVSAKAGSPVYIRSGGNTSTAEIAVTSTYAKTALNLGIGTIPDGTLHIDSGLTGAATYALRTDATSLDYALYVSSSGNVAIGGLVPANQLNHKLVVFSGSIALRGPNEAAYSYRLNDTAGTNRNALYVSSSNYLNVGNAAFAGLQLFHTGSFETALDATGEFGVRQIYGNSADSNDVLGVPDKWLAVRINNVNYVMPMYQV